MEAKNKYASNYREQMMNALNKAYDDKGIILKGIELAELFELDYNSSKGFICTVRMNFKKSKGIEVRTSSPKKIAKFGIFYESITEVQYNELYIEQEGKCGLCGRKRKLIIDHCHKSGRVRKLLCSSCNTGLGLFQDNPSILQKAISFIKDSWINNSTNELLEEANNF